MVALATLGACFGVLAVIAIVLFFPNLVKQHDELIKLRYDLNKLKETPRCRTKQGCGFRAKIP